MPPTPRFFLQIEGPGISRSFEIPLGITSIGRDAGNVLQLPEAMVSRRHAQVISTGLECQVIDLDSANGTLLNGEKLPPQAPVTLEPGMVIAIASFQLTFQVILEEETAAQPQAAPPAGMPGQGLEAEGEPQPVAAPPAFTRDSSSTSRGQIGEESSQSGLELPPGLSTESIRLLGYLPGVYQTPFMSHLMALFEAILLPIEWQIDNFDLFLDPQTAPAGFLPWLANWLAITFDPGWDEYRQRLFLNDAHLIYARQGTRWAMTRILEIYTGCTPEIVEFEPGKDPFTFSVRLRSNGQEIHREAVERLIEASKPAYTGYQLDIYH